MVVIPSDGLKAALVAVQVAAVAEYSLALVGQQETRQGITLATLAVLMATTPLITVLVVTVAAVVVGVLLVLLGTYMAVDRVVQLGLALTGLA